jgi:hypothetical protein
MSRRRWIILLAAVVVALFAVAVALASCGSASG